MITPAIRRTVIRELIAELVHKVDDQQHLLHSMQVTLSHLEKELAESKATKALAPFTAPMPNDVAVAETELRDADLDAWDDYAQRADPERPDRGDEG